MSITKILENIGQQSNLKYSAVDYEKLLTELFVPISLKKALIANDKEQISKLSGCKKDIICFISSPEKEGDVPVDNNEPPMEDESFPQAHSLPKAG